MSDTPTSWSHRDNYESFMGRWSKQIASRFLSWLKNDHDTNHKNWIDVGCGTGALSYQIFNTTDPHYILGIDPAVNFLPQSSPPVLEFKVASSDHIPPAKFEIDFVVSGLAFNFMIDSNQSLRQMLSQLIEGGVIALYVWDYALKMEFLRYFWNAVIENDEDAVILDEGNKFPICNPEELEKLFSQHNLYSITTEIIDIPTYFTNFDEYWTPFLGGQGPAGAYVQSCSDTQLEKIKSTLRNNLPIDEDGSISLVARAFAIKAIKT